MKYSQLAAQLFTVRDYLLNAGIEVEFDSQYQSMFSYKAKNAAFLLEDGRVIVKGGALRSRGRAPVLRRYLHDTLRMLLERRQDDAGRLFDSYAQAIAAARCQSKTYANLRPCIPLWKITGSPSNPAPETARPPSN